MCEILVPGYFIPFTCSKIVWIEGSGNYSWIHLENGQCYLTSVTLKWFEDRLDAFMRIHKSILINSEYLETVRHQNAVLRNGIQLNISRRRIHAIRSQFRVMRNIGIAADSEI